MSARREAQGLDEESLVRLPPGILDEDTEPEDEERDERRGGTHLESFRFRPPNPVPCAVCQEPCGGGDQADVVMICPRHLRREDGPEPQVSFCGEIDCAHLIVRGARGLGTLISEPSSRGRKRLSVSAG